MASRAAATGRRCIIPRRLTSGVKLLNPVAVGGRRYSAPQGEPMNIASVVGCGSTILEAVKQCAAHAAQLGAERSNLRRRPRGPAVRIDATGPDASAELKSYFDTTVGFTFVRLRGRYRLSFRAKRLSSATMLHAHVKRIVNGRLDYLEQDFPLTQGWANYEAEFTANDGAETVRPVEAGFVWRAVRCCWTMLIWNR